MPRKPSVGPEVVALGGVVVDHVEDDLDARLVQGPHHQLELLHLRDRGRRSRRSRCAGRRSRWSCSPSSSTARAAISASSCTNWCTGISSIAVTPRSRRWSTMTGLARPAYVPRSMSGQARVQLGQPLHVRLVDHRLVVRRARRAVLAPVEERVDHHALRHVRRAVLVVLGCPGRRSGRRTAPRSTRRRPRSPWRTGRAAAWRGCTAGRARARTARARGSRTAGPGRPTARSRARRTRRSRTGESASPRPRRRTGIARPRRRPRRRGRSSFPRRHRWHRGDKDHPAIYASHRSISPK